MKHGLLFNLVFGIIMYMIPFVASMSCPIPKDYYPKPASQPPDWVFGVVWSILYLFVVLNMLILLNSSNIDTPIGGFAIFFALLSFFLNILWIATWGCTKEPKTALWIFIALLFSVGLQMILSYTINPISGILIMPLFVWALYAISLNQRIVETIDSTLSV